MTPIEKRLMEILRDYAAEEADIKFLFTDRESYTVAETYEKAMKLAAWIRRQGVSEKSTVALNGMRTMEAVILFLALQEIGALTVMCDSHSSAKEYLSVNIPELGCDHIVDFEEGEWNLDGTNIDFSGIDCLEMDECGKPDIYEPALMIFTSGTTGKNKGIILTQYNYVNHMYNFGAIKGEYDIKESAIQILPIFHVFGFAQILYSIFYRCPLYFPEVIDIDSICRGIDKYEITRIAFVPSLALAMAKYKIEKGYSLDSLLVACLAGAPSTREQFDYIENTLGLKIAPVYGMSECIGITGAGPECPVDKRATSVGKPFPMNDVKVTEQGEITVKGPALFYGYYGEEKTVPGTYFRTGDIGYIDEDGYLHVTGRIKDIIIRNGNNISAAAVETKMLSLPFVEQAAVIGISDEKCGEVPAALVVLRHGCVFDEEAAHKVMTKLEYPGKIKIVSEIPLNAAGKADKGKIREMWS